MRAGASVHRELLKQWSPARCTGSSVASACSGMPTPLVVHMGHIVQGGNVWGRRACRAAPLGRAECSPPVLPLTGAQV
eukprot:CAMPEP_0177764290 /NCGR_PEP_ID=MMETSP0491_2-20121128/7322_1 /TAXON_ID=63592 /ORGANISM="Tetraselmis chuii, Strain PLY429" /LENGTH=77 /DNA_ID=CAMNT_0019280447 /DNA_START=775 /DNA_END=1008 /DNA_ORIENTATION=-